MTTTSWAPRTEALPWDPSLGALACPGCPEHTATSERDRYEVLIEGVGLAGSADHHDALSVVRRTPDLVSGPYEVPALPEGMPAIAVVDYLERQTFDVFAARAVAATLSGRFADAIVHVWAIGDVTERIAEDAYWDEDPRLFVRTPAVDIAPPDYPTDVGWRFEPEHVARADGATIKLWRGCLYVSVCGFAHGDLVRFGWRDLPGPTPSVATAKG